MSSRGKKTMGGYTVKAACQRLGLGPHTLRAWETRYGAVEPSRSATGRRLYSATQIDRLEKIVSLVNQGHSVGVVARLADDELGRWSREHAAVSPPTHDVKSADPFRKDIERGLRSFDLHRVSSLLDQKRTSLGARLFVLEVLSPVMRWTGEMVQRGRFSIAHEHAFSAVVRDQLFQTLRYGSVSPTQDAQPRFVLATPEDDLHEFGILMAAALFSHHGRPSHLLGANLPAEALALAVKAIGGDVIVLGNAPVPDSERKVSFEQYLVSLHDLLPKDVAIWIGGAGKVPHLRRVMPGRETRLLGSLSQLDSLIERPGGIK